MARIVGFSLALNPTYGSTALRLRVAEGFQQRRIDEGAQACVHGATLLDAGGEPSPRVKTCSQPTYPAPPPSPPSFRSGRCAAMGRPDRRVASRHRPVRMAPCNSSGDLCSGTAQGPALRGATRQPTSAIRRSSASTASVPPATAASAEPGRRRRRGSCTVQAPLRRWTGRRRHRLRGRRRRRRPAEQEPPRGRAGDAPDDAARRRTVWATGGPGGGGSGAILEAPALTAGLQDSAAMRQPAEARPWSSWRCCRPPTAVQQRSGPWWSAPTLASPVPGTRTAQALTAGRARGWTGGSG